MAPRFRMSAWAMSPYSRFLLETSRFATQGSPFCCNRSAIETRNACSEAFLWSAPSCVTALIVANGEVLSIGRGFGVHLVTPALQFERREDAWCARGLSRGCLAVPPAEERGNCRKALRVGHVIPWELRGIAPVGGSSLCRRRFSLTERLLLKRKRSRPKTAPLVITPAMRSCAAKRGARARKARCGRSRVDYSCTSKRATTAPSYSPSM